MVLTGMFDRFPNLKIIVGHLGEGLCFPLDRLDEALKLPDNRPMASKQPFCDHFYITRRAAFFDASVAVFDHANGD
jgi:predicted TIM-barrel fold metal-dependent hydrolase